MVVTEFRWITPTSMMATLWIADVGQNEYEEINRVTADTNLVGGRGVDFGWSSFEGYTPFNDVLQSTVELGVVAMQTSIERDHRGEIVIATATGDVVSVVRP